VVDISVAKVSVEILFVEITYYALSRLASVGQLTVLSRRRVCAFESPAVHHSSVSAHTYSTTKWFVCF
jgi:hypothetical protein